MRNEARFLVLMWLVGCSAGASSPSGPHVPGAAAAEETDAASEPAMAQPVPVSIPMAGAPASWLEPHLDAGVDDPLSPVTLTAAGDKVAVVHTRAGYFALGPMGADGPLPVPAHTRWVGVGGKGDTLLAATDAGDLYRATYPTRPAATPPGTKAPPMRGQPSTKVFTKLASVPGATSWDAVPGWIVAAVGRDVRVSRNGRKRFRRRRVVRRGTVERVLVRTDGVIVARVSVPVRGAAPASVVFQARARGRFRKAAFQVTRLVRDGARIHDGADSCNVALAADGIRWVLDDGDGDWRDPEAWSALLAHGEAAALTAPSPRPTARVPAAPKGKAAEALVGTDKRCMGTTHTRPVRHGRGTLRHVTRAGVLGGLFHSRGPAVYPSRTDAALLRDVECGPSEVVGHVCKKGALPRGKAHVAVFDRKLGAARIVDTPPGCTPVRVFSVHGLTLLSCNVPGKPGHVSLRALSGMRFVSELTDMRDTGSRRAVAADGAIAVYSSCNNKPCVWVRKPYDPGAADAWRRVMVPSAVAYRVLPAGGVLAMARVGARAKTPGDPETVELVVDLPDGKRTPVAKGVRIESRIQEFSAAPDGRVLLTFEGAAGAKSRKVYVATDGRLVDVQVK